MASSIEIRERQKHHFGCLLKLKKDNKNITITGLEEALLRAMLGMDAEDVAYVEKLIDAKAFD